MKNNLNMKKSAKQLQGMPQNLTFETASFILKITSLYFFINS